MHFYHKALLAGLMGILFIGSGRDAVAAERGRGCRRGDRIRIQDLDMSPDPLMEGQRIRVWRVKIRFDGNRECDTDVEIREGNNVVAKDRISLRPGVNDINIRPDERYTFRGRENCLNVVVDLEGTRNQVDADRRFCARQRSSWSLSEPGDRPGSGYAPGGGYR
jgi:hypothetical protein